MMSSSTSPTSFWSSKGSAGGELGAVVGVLEFDMMDSTSEAEVLAMANDDDTERDFLKKPIDKKEKARYYCKQKRLSSV